MYHSIYPPVSLGGSQVTMLACYGAIAVVNAFDAEAVLFYLPHKLQHYSFRMLERLRQ